MFTCKYTNYISVDSQAETYNNKLSNGPIIYLANHKIKLYSIRPIQVHVTERTEGHK